MHEEVLVDRVQVTVGSLDEPEECASTTMSGHKTNFPGLKSTTSCLAFNGAALRYQRRRSTMGPAEVTGQRRNRVRMYREYYDI